MARAKDETGGEVEAFELIGRLGVELAVRNMPGLRDPLESRTPWSVLIEIASARSGAAEAALESLLSDALEHGLITDAAIAQSDDTGQGVLGHARGPVGGPEARGRRPGSTTSRCRFRASPSSSKRRRRPCSTATRACRIDAFGHVGDGNIHFDVLGPAGRRSGRSARPPATRAPAWSTTSWRRLGGSISAEHGLGTMKTAEALLYKSPVEVAALRASAPALDPKRIMNPRVLF